MNIKTPLLNIEIEPLFLTVIFITILSSIFRQYITSYFICYLFIFFHELSHMFVASILAKEIDKFKFSISGVSIKFKENSYFKNKKIENIKNMAIYFAGPLSNLLLAYLFKSNKMIFNINIFLALVNLLPIFPLDGYNILKNIFFIMNGKENKIKNIFKIIYIITFVIVLSFAIIQIIITKNPSIFIFLIYIYIINQKNNKERKYFEIVTSSIY